MKIAILDDYQDAFRKQKAFGKLAGHDVVAFTDTEKDPARLAERLKDADAIVLTQQRSSFPRAVIERLPKLKLICQTGSGTGHIDVAACTEKGIAVCAAGSGRSNSTAELTWGLILCSLRRLPFEVKQLREGRWQSTVGVEVKGKTLGIYALGKIGGIVATVGKAFGMRVVCLGREATRKRAAESGYEFAASRESFFSECDIISLHMPLNKETRGIVKKEDLLRMKPTALFVNPSRAGLVADGALVEALKAGRPGFAATDVYEEEPVPSANYPLLKMDNVVCTPHLGYVTEEGYDNFYTTIIDGLAAFAAGKPINVTNPDALKK
jgi:D-3-phosphoglycerate dehydrogenase